MKQNKDQSSAAVRGEAVAIMGAPSSVEEKAFNAFWYGHMLEELMQPPLCSIDYSTAKYIWNSARAADAPSEPSELQEQLDLANEHLCQAVKNIATAKNFHRSLCDRFGYCHDDKDWLRDLVSLEEFIAAKVKSRAAVRGEAVAECALPPAGWYCMRAAGHSGPCAAVAKPIDHEKEVLEVIGQRDKYHDMADQLAAQIAAMTEVEIGEHSSDNEPWRNALIAGDEFIAAKFKAFCNGPVSARAADAPSEPSELGMRLRLLAGGFNPWTEHHRDLRDAADALDSQPTFRPWQKLWDSQWVNIVNHDQGYESMDKVDAVHLAVKMTEERLKLNNTDASSQPTDGGVRK